MVCNICLGLIAINPQRRLIAADRSGAGNGSAFVRGAMLIVQAAVRIFVFVGVTVCPFGAAAISVSHHQHFPQTYQPRPAQFSSQSVRAVIKTCDAHPRTVDEQATRGQCLDILATGFGAGERVTVEPNGDVTERRIITADGTGSVGYRLKIAAGAHGQQWVGFQGTDVPAGRPHKARVSSVVGGPDAEVVVGIPHFSVARFTVR
jgi:hypothetical protein